MDTAELPIAKDRFTALDTLAVAKELRAGGRMRFDKSFDVSDGGVAIAFRVPGAGRKELVVSPGRYAAFVPERVEHTEELGNLSKELRRLLSGAVVTSVAEPRGERSLEVHLARSEAPEPFTLAIELFGTGNVIVVRGDSIVAVWKARAWAHRLLRVGAKYERPPHRGDPWSAGTAELEAQLLASRTNRVTTLAARLGLGGPVAEELLVRCGVAGDVPAPTDASNVAKKLRATMDELLSELGDAPQGYLYRRGEAWTDVEPFRSRRWRDSPEIEEVPIGSFSEAAYTYFTSHAPVVPTPARASDVRRAELDRQLERQRQAIAEFDSTAKGLVKTADLLFEHYTEAESLRAKAEKSENPKEGPIELAIGETKIAVDPSRPIAESARELYDESKRIRTKLAGAEAAIKETEHQIEALQRSAEFQETRSTRKASETPRTKRFWFERFRWFFSSDGNLVLAGRDAPSNDMLVRRYLHQQDIYVHADIHGAPSVVVRHPEDAAAPIAETTLSEAGQFGVSFSKAWRAGLASASAFWVRPDQVSKAGASGEFVPRGAFVIHGTKNILRDLPTEIAIGTIDYEGATLWTAAPPSSLRRRGKLRLVLVPGEERERSALEPSLSRELGIPRPLLQSLLPAGGIQVRRA
jgi:predicted ribosome quality control (RQC) complex YloA/Tae2 family protein